MENKEIVITSAGLRLLNELRINRSEMCVLWHLLENFRTDREVINTEEYADALGFDVPRINRALKNLSDYRLLQRDGLVQRRYQYKINQEFIYLRIAK